MLCSTKQKDDPELWIVKNVEEFVAHFKILSHYIEELRKTTKLLDYLTSGLRIEPQTFHHDTVKSAF